MRMRQSLRRSPTSPCRLVRAGSCARACRSAGVGTRGRYCARGPRPSRDLYIATWRALAKIRDDGLARSIGVSNFPADPLERLLAETDKETDQLSIGSSGESGESPPLCGCPRRVRLCGDTVGHSLFAAVVYAIVRPGGAPQWPTLLRPVAVRRWHGVPDRRAGILDAEASVGPRVWKALTSSKRPFPAFNDVALLAALLTQ